MEIRVADKLLDLGDIIHGARAFAAQTDLDDVLPDLQSERFTDAVMRIVDLPDVTVLLAHEGGRLAGGIGMLLAPYLWNPALLQAEELFWWCAPDAPARAALQLLKAARMHAELAGAKVLTFGRLSTSPPGVVAVYKRMGLREIQSTFMGMI